MNTEHKQLIKNQIDTHIKQIKNFRSLSESDVMNARKLTEYMDASSVSKNFFANLNTDDLMSKYVGELNEVSSALGNSNFNTKQKILNFLEYIRLSGMYENVDMNKFFIPNLVASISQSGLNIALLGKGVCASQASFPRDLLITSGEEGRTDEVWFMDEDGMIEDQHLVTYANTEENGFLFLDPTWYNGTVNSIKGSLNSASIPEQRRAKLSSLDITQEDIEEARNTTLDYLISRYKIKEISEQLGLSSLNDLDKQIRMLTFMEKNLAPATEDFLCRSVVIGDHEIEVGKLLELFYKANDIPYTLQCSGDKYHSTYKTTIDGQETILSPKDAFMPNRNNTPLSRKLHFAKNNQGENQFLWQFSPEREQQIKNSIMESRKTVETVSISTLLKTSSNKNFSAQYRVSTKPVNIEANTPNETIQQNSQDNYTPELDE